MSMMIGKSSSIHFLISRPLTCNGKHLLRRQAEAPAKQLDENTSLKHAVKIDINKQKKKLKNAKHNSKQERNTKKETISSQNKRVAATGSASAGKHAEN